MAVAEGDLHKLVSIAIVSFMSMSVVDMYDLAGHI